MYLHIIIYGPIKERLIKIINMHVYTYMSAFSCNDKMLSCFNN
jgi:hypothetical protein